ncbi:MAG TPA: phenylalanine--tRNA ligase subunit alpha [Candidatus Norongarragalinales archaeon]|nr:phenylalanine--tRNA ligase subunit alpha [Candidatus Norongarragalinales archaeon]
MKDLEKTLLSKASLEKKSVEELSRVSGIPVSSIMSVLQSLKEAGFVTTTVEVKRAFGLSQEGLDALKSGLPEKRLVSALKPKTPFGIRDLEESLRSKPAALGGLKEGEFAIALQWAKKLSLATIQQGQLVLISQEDSPHDSLLKKIGGGVEESSLNERENAVLFELEKRRLVEKKILKKTFIQATREGLKALTQEREGVITQLNPQLLKSGEWRGKKFASYDLTTLVAPVSAGKKHAYKQLLLEIKQKLVGMGFAEAHGPLVELEFWNMDALFMAQDHPAREIHDVFQVQDPAKGEILDKKLLEGVRKAHEKGLAGSKGWRYNWDPEISARLVLRSHTTPVSARNLAKGLKPPQRIFCIGRVFRPDEIDWKHFIEFNQCEGIVVDESMSFRELLGYLKEFALEVFGAKEVKFCPSYFPFTEPSVEMYAKIPGKGWAEVGGAGMFRPEMLAALGVDVPVLAWGLGIDRLAMIKLGLKDIRDLFSQDLALLRK